MLQTTNLGVRSSNLFGRATSEYAIDAKVRRFPDARRQAVMIERELMHFHRNSLRAARHQVSGTKSCSPIPCKTRNTAEVSPALATR